MFLKFCNMILYCIKFMLFSNIKKMNNKYIYTNTMDFAMNDKINCMMEFFKSNMREFMMFR